MTQLPPDLQAIKLCLLDGVDRNLRRRRRRLRALRSTLTWLVAAGTFATSALAAGDALGVIHLSGGARAERVAGYPAYDVTTKETVLVGHSRHYVYHITGGRDAPGCTHPNDIYVTSTQALNPTELRAAVNAADGIDSKEETAGIKGLISLSTTCGHPGIEAVVGVKPPLAGERPRPVTIYGRVNARKEPDRVPSHSKGAR